MTSIAQGVNKQTRIARQSAKGTLASASGGQVLRRKTSTFELAKETTDTTAEITATQQVVSSRHSVRTVNGKLSAILSPGTYADPLSAVLRRDFAAVPAITGASVTIAGSGPLYTVARAAGSFLADGIKIGMVVRLAAAGLNAANAGKNLLVTDVSATVLEVLVLNGSDLAAEGPIASATVSVPGKVSYVPTSGHSQPYYTVEEWYADAEVSERNQDVKFTQAALALPGTGNATVDFTAIGLDQTSGDSAYFTAPAVESTTPALVAASGILLVNGAVQAVVTDLSCTIDGSGAAADGVVGSNVRPDVFSGKVKVSGSFTVYFEGGVVPNLFVEEISTSIVSALTAGGEADADFLTLTMSNVKLNSSTPDDNETGLKRTYNYMALLNAAGGAGAATELTTVQIQDSAAA